MSSMDSKRSKRRRNKRGSAKARQKICNVSGGSNVSVVHNNVDSFSQSHAQLSDNLKKMPSTQPVSELDLDNIPQPLTGPKSHNPYLDRDHCLLCRRERPDPPRGSFSSIIGDGKDGEEQLLNTTSMPLWLCPECRQNVEEEERNSKTYDSPSLPQDVFASSNLPLIPPMDGYMGLPSGDGIGGRKAASEEPCSCVKCKEQKMIIAEEEKAKIKLAGCWSELSHMVRCVYLEAGTALADEASSTKLCLPRIAELVQRLCAHDPHQLFLRLEIEVEDFVKEVKERLLKRLSEGYKSPPLARQFMTMLMEEYTSLISASKTLSTVLDKLEKEHLSKFNLTWVLHNKHLFHSMVYLEPELHNKLSQLLKYLQQGSQKESYHSEESFAKLCQRYFVFSDEMTDLSESWREHQQLIESYVEKREVSRTRELLAQQKTNWDFKFPPFPLSGDTKTHSSHCYHGDKRCSQNDASKETGDLAPCNCKAKCLYQTGRIPHQNALYNNLDEGLIPPQLVALEEDYNFLQSIQPPNLSSPSSSQDDDSEEMVPIFSRGRCIDPGMCSPCDSIDSDDLTSESSHDAASQDAGYDEDDDEESEGCNYNKRNRNTASEKLSNSSSSSKGDSAYQSNQTCECHACITSAMQSAKLPPASAIGTSTTDTSANLTPNDLRTQTSPYLFYPNLTNHQPLDLSHHGITAKHPLIHPHLYNFSSQKPATSMQPQPFQLVDTSPLHLSSGKVNVYENAKMSLYPRNYDHPDLFQSVNDALQTNSKLDKSAFPSSSVVGKSHTKDQEEETGSSLSKVVCSSQGTRDSMGLYNPAQFSVDAWARQQFMAQQQQNGTLGPVTSTHPSDCCPKHLTQTQRIPSPSSSSPAIGHAYPHHGTISAAAATLSATQQPLVQPMSPLLGNLQATDPQAFGSLKRASLVDPINGQSLTTPSSQTPLHQHVQHQSTCKKKKGYGDLDRYHQDRGCNLSCMQMPEFSPDIHQQSVCALHNQPGMVPSVGSAVDPVHTAGSTSTSASVCSDPDCDTHNFNDDDLCGNSDDHSSSTTSSSRERDSKHCGCCYCEVFGHGGPALAPMSRNYPEMRERLRLKLRERQQHPKDESPSHTHSPVSMDQPRNPSIPLNKENLEALVSYINGEKPKAKSSSSKAAKRQRQKQRKAAQRAKQESQTKRLTCPSKEEPSEKCQNLSTQSTPTKSNKSQQNQPLPPSSLQQPPPPTGSHEELIRKRYLLGIDNDHTQNTPASGKLKVLDRKRAKPPAAAFTSKEPNATSKSSSSRTTDSPAQTSSSSEERRKEMRPKSAGLPEEAGVDGNHRIREGAWKKADKKTDAPIPKVTVINNKKKDSLRVVQEVPKTAAAQRTTANGQQGLTNGNIKSSSGGSLTASKAANGTTAVASPGTPRRTNGSKKDSAKKEAINGSSGVEDRKKPTLNGPSQQNKTEAKEQKQSSKLKAKIAASDESAKKAVSTNNSTKASGKKQETPPVENGHLDGKNHVMAKQTNSHKRPENNLKATGRVNGVIDSHSVVNSDPSAALTNSSKKKKKKKPGESNSLNIDDIFLPKENVDMNEMDPVELELEAFKRFCMDSTPQRKKEKVVFNVKDIILNAKKT